MRLLLLSICFIQNPDKVYDVGWQLLNKFEKLGACNTEETIHLYNNWQLSIPVNIQLVLQEAAHQMRLKVQEYFVSLR